MTLIFYSKMNKNKIYESTETLKIKNKYTIDMHNVVQLCMSDFFRNLLKNGISSILEILN